MSGSGIFASMKCMASPRRGRPVRFLSERCGIRQWWMANPPWRTSAGIAPEVSRIPQREVEALLLGRVPEPGMLEPLSMPARQVPHAAVLHRRVVEGEPHADGAVPGDVEVVVVLVPADLAAGARRLVDSLVVDEPEIRPEQALHHVEEPRIVDDHAEDRMAQVCGPNLVHLKLVVAVFAGLHVLQHGSPAQGVRPSPCSHARMWSISRPSR